MSREYVKIYCCGDCINYNWKKHSCNRGANKEGAPTDHFYRDCPSGIFVEEEADPKESMPGAACTDLILLVSRMRDAQRRFFKTKDRAYLMQSKDLERKVDALIQRMQGVESVGGMR